MSGFGRGRFGRGVFGSSEDAPIVETVTIVEALVIREIVPLAESVGIGEDVDVQDGLLLSESVSIFDLARPGEFALGNIGGYLVRVTFPTEVHYDGLGDAINFLLAPAAALEEPGAPLAIAGLQPIVNVLQSGSDGVVVPEEGRLDAISTSFRLTGSLDANLNLGDFLTIKTGQNAGTYQIVEVLEPGGPEAVVRVDRAMVLADGTDVEWEHTSGVGALDITTSKLTNGGAYLFAAKNLYQKWPKFPVALEGDFRAQGVPQPQVVGVSANSEGLVTVEFDEVMQQDPGNLGNPQDYAITGPTGHTAATVSRVHFVSERSVGLSTSGLGSGELTLTVSTNTPKDIAGNPVDPAFNEAVFVGVAPILTRSVFTDKGPLVKPPLTLDSGVGITLESTQVISLQGAALTTDFVGRRLRLSGSDDNDGEYEILAVLSPTSARVKTRFHLPEESSGATAWDVFDPRTGQIADDPSDVVVRVGGIPVTPEAVIGLKGQVVLPVIGEPGGLVEVDYSWFSNPKVEIRRLNSLEFRFNAWNRDPGGYSPSNHQYRFNNVLVTPSKYEPDDIAASQDQPLLRDVKYRAYERAYTALLNDPTRLLFNTPIHRIAFPPAQRVLSEEVVFYEASTLPEAAASPWVRKGAGTAVVGAGQLVVVDNSAETFPAGSPLFWTRSVDLTFDHVFSVAWRFSVDAVTATEGVWTGLAAGYANARVAYVLGYLLDGGVRKIGFLRRGARDAVSVASAWMGGVDSDGAPTGTAVALDWAVLHSYRMFTDRAGVVRLYIDGSIVESLRILPEEAPFLEELNAPFDEVQGAFFGSLSRPATSTSTWDFFRYVVQPINAFQTAPSSFVAYEGDVLPEMDPSPWTPVGFHGTAGVSSGVLTVESTSATDASTSAAAGLVGGDFHGYVKLEPLLTAASQVVVDVWLQMLTLTHGIDPDGLMLAVDDGTLLLQLCFLAGEASPRLSYGGRSFPEDFAPFAWSSLGSQTAVMCGRTLRITDSSTTDGKVYFVEDAAPPGSATRAIDSAFDYIFEARLAVVSYETDAEGFAGAFVQVFDGTRAVGIKLKDVSGVRYVTFHSDGVDLAFSDFVFDWADGVSHTYRVRKAAGDLVTVFVDGTLIGVHNYAGFEAPAADAVGILSFGSSTPASDEAQSVVDWSYCNAWRVDPTPRRYMGLWKGTDRNSLTGYHLPVKASGRGQVVGNILRDVSEDFDAAGLTAGDPIVIDDGPNKGVYIVQAVATTELTIPGLWPAQPSIVAYRVARQTDWSMLRSYRLARDGTGTVTVAIDAEDTPAIRIDYDPTMLPESGAGVLQVLSGGLPAVAFGSFSAEHLEQSRWDYVRYGITRSATDLEIVPPHQVLNQWNVMESAERLAAVTPVALTSFKSSSTGSTPQTDPDYLARTDVPAHTQLNQDTPPIPWTQTSERRAPFTRQVLTGTPYTYETREYDGIDLNPGSGGMWLTFNAEAPGMAFMYVSVEPLSPNGPLQVGSDVTHIRVTWDSGSVRGSVNQVQELDDSSPPRLFIVLEGVTATTPETFLAAGTVTFIVEGEEQIESGYVVNDGQKKYVFSIPEDVLYTSLQLVESSAGAEDLLAPFGDAPNPALSGVDYQREVCLAYDANTLPEDDVASPTPWSLVSDAPDEVAVSVLSGVLTYGTSSTGTRTVYLNNTPLPDAPSLRTEATFDIRLAEDATLGVGDSQIRFGLSAPGMTIGLGFVTHANGERFVEVFDLNSGDVVGRATVDYLDGDSHTYRIVRDPSAGVVEVHIDEGR